MIVTQRQAVALPPLSARQEEAMRLVDEGMAVVPLHPIIWGAGKQAPLCPGFFSAYPHQHHCAGPGKCPAEKWSYATDEPSARRLFDPNDGERGFAVHCGQSRLLALDADERHGGLEAVARLVRDFHLPVTWADDRGDVSPHLYFQEPRAWAGLRLPATIRLFGYEGVELLSGRHLCTVGGSDHESGDRREWVNPPWDYALASLPAAFLDYVVRACANRDIRRRATVHLGGDGRVDEGASEGRLIADGTDDIAEYRNNSLFAAARSLVCQGYAPADVVDRIRDTNERRCCPPLDRCEVDGILASALASGVPDFDGYGEDVPGLTRREIDALLAGRDSAKAPASPVAQAAIHGVAAVVRAGPPGLPDLSDFTREKIEPLADRARQLRDEENAAAASIKDALRDFDRYPCCKPRHVVLQRNADGEPFVLELRCKKRDCCGCHQWLNFRELANAELRFQAAEKAGLALARFECADAKEWRRFRCKLASYLRFSTSDGRFIVFATLLSACSDGRAVTAGQALDELRSLLQLPSDGKRPVTTSHDWKLPATEEKSGKFTLIGKADSHAIHQLADIADTIGADVVPIAPRRRDGSIRRLWRFQRQQGWDFDSREHLYGCLFCGEVLPYRERHEAAQTRDESAKDVDVESVFC